MPRSKSNFIPHPLISLSLITSSICALAYSQSPYSLRKITIPQQQQQQHRDTSTSAASSSSSPSPSYVWCITKSIQMKPAEEVKHSSSSTTIIPPEAIYKHDRLYIVKETKITNFFFPQSSYTLQKLIAKSHDYVENNNCNSTTFYNRNRIMRFQRRDPQTSFGIEVNKLIMWDDEKNREFVEDAKEKGRERNRVLSSSSKSSLFWRGTFGHFVKMGTSKELSDLRKENITNNDIDNNDNYNNIDDNNDESPLILKTCPRYMTWKSQVHEEPYNFILPSSFSQTKMMTVHQFDQDDDTVSSVKERDELMRTMFGKRTVLTTTNENVSKELMKRLTRRDW